MFSRYGKDCTYSINNLYKLIPEQHPFMRWLFNKEENIDWLKEYGILLQCEYSQRTGHKHAGSRDTFDFIDDFRPPIGLEPEAFLNRAWDDLFDYSSIKDVHAAYRNLLCARWTIAKLKPTWGDRLPPSWYIEYQIARSPTNIGELESGQKTVSFTVENGKGKRGCRRVSYKEGISGGCDVH